MTAPNILRKHHGGRLEKSERLRALIWCLKKFRGGATTLTLAEWTGSVAVHSDITDARRNGLVITRTRELNTPEGRQVHRYRLGEKK